MKKVFLILVSIFVFESASGQVREMPLDFKLIQIQLQPGQVLYGWQMFPSWHTWLQRPMSGPLIIKIPSNTNDIEIFEARVAAVIKKPVSAFTSSRLLNIDTIRRLNPGNQHTQLEVSPFTIETIVPFPTDWADIIAVAKKAKLLADKTTPFLKMESILAFAPRQVIEKSPDLQRIVKILDITGKPVEGVSIQATPKVNQIADFISIITLFYKQDEERTLVVSFAAAAIKKHILNMGISAGGLKLNGRSVLLGENSFLNSDQGIGSGLPKYFLEFYTNMLAGLQN